MQMKWKRDCGGKRELQKMRYRKIPLKFCIKPVVTFSESIPIEWSNKQASCWHRLHRCSISNPMLVCTSTSQRCANLICIMNIWIFINYVSAMAFSAAFQCCLYQFCVCWIRLDSNCSVKLTAIPHDSVYKSMLDFWCVCIFDFGLYTLEPLTTNMHDIREIIRNEMRRSGTFWNIYIGIVINYPQIFSRI